LSKAIKPCWVTSYVTDHISSQDIDILDIE